MTTTIVPGLVAVQGVQYFLGPAPLQGGYFFQRTGVPQQAKLVTFDGLPLGIPDASDVPLAGFDLDNTPQLHFPFTIKIELDISPWFKHNGAKQTWTLLVNALPNVHVDVNLAPGAGSHTETLTSGGYTAVFLLDYANAEQNGGNGIYTIALTGPGGSANPEADMPPGTTFALNGSPVGGSGFVSSVGRLLAAYNLSGDAITLIIDFDNWT